MGNQPCTQIRSCNELKAKEKKRPDQLLEWHARMRESRSSQMLFQSSANGDHHSAMMALVSHGNPNSCNPEGITALMTAAAGGHTETVRLLITSGARVNARCSKTGLSSLALTAGCGHENILRLLLQWEADPNTGAIRGRTPLMLASLGGKFECVQILLQNKADIDMYDRHGCTALLKAVDRRQLEVTRYLITQEASVVRMDKYARSALSRVIELLLKMPVLRFGRFGEPELWAEIAAVMVDMNANVNSSDYLGDTLLVKAVRADREDVCRLLIKFQALVDLPTLSLHGGTCVLLAVENQYSNIVDCLINSQADVNLQNRHCMSPLQAAIDRGNEILCRKLLDAKASAEITDKDGESLLLKCAINGIPDIYKLLLDYGVSHEIVDDGDSE